MSIRLEHVSYAYEDNSSKKNYALKDVNLEIKKEEFTKVFFFFYTLIALLPN